MNFSLFLNKLIHSLICQLGKQNNNFSYVIAPEHDGLTGKNVYSTKGAMHYLTKEEIVSPSIKLPPPNFEKINVG